MSKTLAEHSAAYRARRNAKLARTAKLEDGHRQIVALAGKYGPAQTEEWALGYSSGLGLAAIISLTALGEQKP